MALARPCPRRPAVLIQAINPGYPATARQARPPLVRRGNTWFKIPLRNKGEFCYC